MLFLVYLAAVDLLCPDLQQWHHCFTVHADRTAHVWWPGRQHV